MGGSSYHSGIGKNLLPASRPPTTGGMRGVPSYALLVWTLGNGSVVWRIWPAVLIHTTFAAIVVIMSMRHIVNLQIPSVMLTVLGVVIGFVISYRASSGYERYWLGRTCWSDVIRHSRTLSRLIWFHVPPRLTPKTAHEIQTGQLDRSRKELNKVMAEKLVALDLVEGFAVALKHHMRGEVGIYYEDLYHCVRPMHEHEHNTGDGQRATDNIIATSLPSPRRAQRIAKENSPPPTKHALLDVEAAPATSGAYGTFDTASNAVPPAAPSHSVIHNLFHRESSASNVSIHSEHQQLLPSSQPPPPGDIMGKVSEDIIPFAGIISSLKRKLHPDHDDPKTPVPPPPPQEVQEPGTSVAQTKRTWRGPIHPALHTKHRPKVAGGGENLPLEILRCISEWCSTLEDRGTVPGSSMGPMMAAVAGLEESLTALERILTTPLPFVYSVHIRHTVWIYLFFLPFQLVNQFGYYAIPGVAIASFIYLGFIAAGEEIEQPFGYDENDLDLDLFCREIIHADIQQIKSSPCLNAYFDPDAALQGTVAVGIPPPRRSLAVSEVTNLAKSCD